MPKQKTHRGATKRFSLTKSGKIKRAKAFRNHCVASTQARSPKQKRNLRKGGLVDSTEARKIKQLIPYK